ncbi:MAG: uracil-DNA glycosylase family protein [Hyphomonadaceae bacterium]
MRMPEFETYLKELRACTLCKADMERAPNPILQVSPTARILIAGQAPGNLADTTGIPFNDPSGDRLRDWMGVTRDEFYDAGRIAIVPMGFCFPGYDKSGGDIPPMKRCAGVWHEDLMARLPDIRLKLLVGGYAQKWHLKEKAAKTLTETVRNWRDLGDELFPTPHPSWRNTGWLKRNPWFEAEMVPVLRASVRSLLDASS